MSKKRVFVRAISAVVLLVGTMGTVHAQQFPTASGPESPPDFPAGVTGDSSMSGMFVLTPVYLVPRDLSPTQGLIVEMALAPPSNIPQDPYDLAKYGRFAVDYTHAGTIEGANIGLAAQALHVAHHLLFYSAGMTTDVNNDGMFLLTAGIAHYQVGNDQSPFVDAPFMRMRFQSSQEAVFAYAEIETTMHYEQYVSGMVGIGFQVTPAMRVIGGFHHTEFVMPEQQIVQMVNGLEGIVSCGL